MKTEILVAGGGIVGLTAALVMRQAGYEVLVADKSMSPIKRVYAINPASIALLNQVNAWQRLKTPSLSAYQKMYIWDQITRANLSFDARTLGKSELGFMIEEQDLKQALLLECERQSIKILSIELTNINEENDSIIVSSDTKSISAQFLLITDGANSKLRQQLNVPITTWPYHQHALVATIRTEKPHQQTAYQVFTPDGPLAFLPLIDPHQCSIVWSTSSTKAKALIDLAASKFNTLLGDTFEHQLGTCELVNERHCFELIMRHAKQYTGKRWALMGDAAHTIHPLAGLGLNLGLGDVTCWNQSIKPNQPITEQMLARYQRSRKSEVWQIIGLMESLKFVFSHPLAPIQALRQIGMNALEHFTPLKRLIMGFAANI